MAAMAEQMADADGLLWPISVAPYEAVQLCLNEEEDGAIAQKLCDELEAAGVSVLYDDRAERAGVKFNDADLIGIPIQIVVGRSAKDGKVEMRVRGRSEKKEVALSHAAAEAAALKDALLAELDGAADAVRPGV